MIDDKTLQTFMKTSGFYAGLVDGIFGNVSFAAARAMLAANKVNAKGWPNSNVKIGLTQLFLNKVNDAGLIVDGEDGPRTRDATYIYGTTLLGTIQTYWPKQSDVRSGKSMFGQPGQKNLVRVELPYPQYVDYDRKPSHKITSFMANSKLENSIKRVLQRVLEHYGLEQIKKLNLDINSGCYNYRRTTSSSSLSMHAWGIAIDWDSAHNEFDEGRDEAAFAKPVYSKFLDFWEEEGWVSLGRARNYDWMHVQAARL